MVAWVTVGLVAPGVQVGSGSRSRPLPRAWQLPAPGGADVAGAVATELVPDEVPVTAGGRPVVQKLLPALCRHPLAQRTSAAAPVAILIFTRPTPPSCQGGG